MVHVLSKDNRAIHLYVKDKLLNHETIISGIYGTTQERDKHLFWDKLPLLNPLFHLAWCIIGDSNELLSPDEKIGGVSITSEKTHRINHFIDIVDAKDIFSIGIPFTWKKWINGKLILEKTQ